MAGTAKNWSPLEIVRGPVELWAGMAVPGAGARATLHTDGTPESVANPNAIHLGRTTEGVVLRMSGGIEYRRSDEFAAPYAAIPGDEEMSMTFSVLQILNYTAWEFLMPHGTKATGSGYEELAFGSKATISTSSFAAIWKDTEDPTKFNVFHIYKGLNEAGMEFNVRRTADAVSPVRIVGQVIDTRAANDTVGKYWRQIT